MSEINKITLIVLDSVGCGELPDADKFGDVGSNTLGNLSKAVGGIKLPNLQKLGLGNTTEIEGVSKNDNVEGAWGKAKEVSMGKDTTTGHWEMAGAPLQKPFPNNMNGFSDEVIKEFEKRTGRKVVWNKAASGTAVINEMGDHQMETGDWIVYTSADPVFQIAAHEEIIPLEELYKACKIALEICNEMSPVARVIARPFIGKGNGNYTRTSNRHDYAIDPPSETVLDRLKAKGKNVVGVGKIRDIFAGHGITEDKGTNKDNLDGIKKTLEAMDEGKDGLLFVNLVDFDMLYGHRRDPRGYADSLEEFDEWLPKIQEKLRDDELLIITADHGNDPTFKGTDHTREYIPILIQGKNIKKNFNIGVRESFADIAATIDEILLGNKSENSFAKEILL